MEQPTYRLVRYHDTAKKSEIRLLQPDEPYPQGWSGLSCGFPTLEELREKAGIPDEPCRVCGSPFSTTYNERLKKKMLEKNICFRCNFWQEITEGQNDKCLRINGDHYKVGPETNDRSDFKGFSGRKFHIKTADGRDIITTNLWHQGEIPPQFKDQLPDNAEFL